MTFGNTSRRGIMVRWSPEAVSRMNRYRLLDGQKLRRGEQHRAGNSTALKQLILGTGKTRYNQRRAIDEGGSAATLVLDHSSDLLGI